MPISMLTSYIDLIQVAADYWPVIGLSLLGNAVF